MVNKRPSQVPAAIRTVLRYPSKLVRTHLVVERLSSPEPVGGLFGNPLGNQGRFPFNKNSGLKFRRFYVFNGTVHSGCTDPTQATARLVIVLASRIQKSGTGDNNFVKWKGTFRSDRPK